MINKTKLFILAAAITLGGLTAANAQVAPQSAIRTKVPFSFVVNGETFAAGTYSFSRLDTSGGNKSQLVMRGADGKSIVFDTVKSIASTTPSKTQLIFDVVDGKHVLTQIWGAGDSEGSVVSTSSSDIKAIAAAAGGASSESTSGADGNQ